MYISKNVFENLDLTVLQDMNSDHNQSSVLGSILYNVLTHDTPQDKNSQTELFVDNTAIIVQSHSLKLAIKKL